MTAISGAVAALAAAATVYLINRQVALQQESVAVPYKMALYELRVRQYGEFFEAASRLDEGVRKARSIVPTNIESLQVVYSLNASDLEDINESVGFMIDDYYHLDRTVESIEVSWPDATRDALGKAKVAAHHAMQCYFSIGPAGIKVPTQDYLNRTKKKLADNCSNMTDRMNDYESAVAVVRHSMEDDIRNIALPMLQ